MRWYAERLLVGVVVHGRGVVIMTITTMAAMAVRAARNRRAWGRWATARYLARRGVPLRLYQIAVALEGGA